MSRSCCNLFTKLFTDIFYNLEPVGVYTIRTEAMWNDCPIFKMAVEGFESWRVESWMDKITNEDLLRRMGTSREIVRQFKTRKSQYLGHLIRRKHYNYNNWKETWRQKFPWPTKNYLDNGPCRQHWSQVLLVGWVRDQFCLYPACCSRNPLGDRDKIQQLKPQNFPPCRIGNHIIFSCIQL